MKPISYDQCEGKLVMQGPMLIPTKPIVLSREWERLDIKLRKSLRSLIYKTDLMKGYV